MLETYKITINGTFVKTIQIVETKTTPDNLEKIKRWLVKTQNYNPNIKIMKVEKRIFANKTFGIPMNNRENFSIHREINKIFLKSV